MEGFGSSSVFVWLRLWHWFGCSLVTVQEFGLSKWLLAMPLVVRGWTASLRALPHFGIETTQEEEYQKCNSVSLWSASAGLGVEVCYWSPPARCVAQWHPFGACRWLTALWVGVQHRNDRGQGSEGGVTGSWTNIGTWEDQQQYFFRAPHFFFKAREGLHILTFFPLSLFLFWRFWSCLWESPSEVSIHIEETF